MTVGWLPRLSALTACGMNKKSPRWPEPCGRIQREDRWRRQGLTQRRLARGVQCQLN
jgi:hypothetical protein